MTVEIRSDRRESGVKAVHGNRKQKQWQDVVPQNRDVGQKDADRPRFLVEGKRARHGQKQADGKKDGIGPHILCQKERIPGETGIPL